MSKKKSLATRRAEASAAAERAAEIRRQHERGERRRRTLFVAAAVVGVFALIFGIGYAVQSSRDTTGEQAALPSGVVDRYAVPRGEASAPVTVTVAVDTDTRLLAHLGIDGVSAVASADLVRPP